MEDVIKSLEQRVTRLETKSEVEQVHRDNVEKRLDKIEGSLTWLTRLIIGAIILAVAGFMISGGFAV